MRYEDLSTNIHRIENLDFELITKSTFCNGHITNDGFYVKFYTNSDRCDSSNEDAEIKLQFLPTASGSNSVVKLSREHGV